MSKKRIINIKLQEVTVDGERSVQYKGSDGKMHDIAAGNGETDGSSTAQEPLILEGDYIGGRGMFFTDGTNYTVTEIIDMIKSGKRVWFKYENYNLVLTSVCYNEQLGEVNFFALRIYSAKAQQTIIKWDSNGLTQYQN